MATKKKQRLTPKQEEWKREIKNLKARIRRANKSSLEIPFIEIPDMPKRITKSKIEEIRQLGRFSTLYKKQRSESKLIDVKKFREDFAKMHKEEGRPLKQEFFGVVIDEETGDITNEPYDESAVYEPSLADDGFTSIILTNCADEINAIYDNAVRDMLMSAFLSVSNEGAESRYLLRSRLEANTYTEILREIQWYENKEYQFVMAQKLLEVIKGSPLSSEELKEVGEVIDESMKIKFGTFKSHKIQNVDRIIKDISENGRIKYSRYDKQALLKAMKEIVMNPERYTQDTVRRAEMWVKVHE